MLDSIIKQELEKAGICVDSVWDLLYWKQPYPEAVPILVALLQEDDIDPRMRNKEGIVRALTAKEARGKANDVLISEYNKSSETDLLESYRWAVGNAFTVVITEDDVDKIIPIVLDKKNGKSRQMFALALGKVKLEKVEDALISLLDDDDVDAHAISALGNMKSQKAKGKIETLVNHPWPLVRKNAIKALKKIG
jgi:HEAT repeat protein